MTNRVALIFLEGPNGGYQIVPFGRLLKLLSIKSVFESCHTNEIAVHITRNKFSLIHQLINDCFWGKYPVIYLVAHAAPPSGDCLWRCRLTAEDGNDVPVIYLGTLAKGERNYIVFHGFDSCI